MILTMSTGWPAIDSTEGSSAPWVLQLSRVQLLKLAQSWSSESRSRSPMYCQCIMGARRTFQQSIPSGLRGHQEVFFSNCFKDGTKEKHLKQRKSFEISLVSFFRKTGHPHIHWYQNYRTILIKIMIDPPCQDPHTMCWRSWVWWCQILFQFNFVFVLQKKKLWDATVLRQLWDSTMHSEG